MTLIVKVVYSTARKFNGIGLIRKAYKDFEAKTGSCYGPKSMTILFELGISGGRCNI